MTLWKGPPCPSSNCTLVPWCKALWSSVAVGDVQPMVTCAALELTSVGCAGVSGAAEQREAKVPERVPVPARL